MAGIYIHIPFCKQACHYCNFHFTTSLLRKNELITALLNEIELRRSYFDNETIETIYFGGGTPSLLSPTELKSIMEKLRSTFSFSNLPEITLEANPDDITEEKLNQWKESAINRLSIGVQSFFEEDLQWMNRAHTANQAHQCIELALKTDFNNLTIDLIYGTPTLSDQKWKENVATAVSYNIPHLSCYALTVEPRTPLQKLIALNKTMDVNPDTQANQFLLLMDWLGHAGYEHYEISNFAKPGFRSKHNSSYWQGKKYAGFGPSAHSYNGLERSWNIANNNIYINSINEGVLKTDMEILTSTQRLNEYIMTSLRTIEGMDLNKIETGWGFAESKRLENDLKKFVDAGMIILNNSTVRLTNEGKLMADGIASELFMI